MTKMNLLAGFVRRHHVADLHFLVADYDPVAEQLHQLPLLLGAGMVEPSPDACRELFDGGRYSGQLYGSFHLPLHLLRLLSQPFLSLFQVAPPPLVLFKRDHLLEVRFRQSLHLPPQAPQAAPQVLSSSLHLLR